MNQMNQRYKLVTAQDGIVWLSLQPCIEDLKEQRDNHTEKHILDALYAVQSFLEAMVLEAQQAEFTKTLKAVEEETPYKDTL